MASSPCTGKPYFMENNKYFARYDVIVEKGYHFDMIPHTHDFIELVYTFRGKITHAIDNNEFPTSKGDLAIINYEQVHNYAGTKNSQYYNFLIKSEYIDKSIASNKDFYALLELNDYMDFKNLVDKNNPIISFSPDEREIFEHILILLDDEIEKKETGYKTLTYSAVSILLIMILRKMSNTYTNMDNSLKEILKYISENYNENISESKLAAICHYNPSYFSRMFRAQTGVTFTDYLKKTRIKSACDMLLHSDAKISDIYSKVGYTDKTKFHRHFKQITGTTPLSYRKNKK